MTSVPSAFKTLWGSYFSDWLCILIKYKESSWWNIQKILCISRFSGYSHISHIVIKGHLKLHTYTTIARILFVVSWNYALKSISTTKAIIKKKISFYFSLNFFRRKKNKGKTKRMRKYSSFNPSSPILLSISKQLLTHIHTHIDNIEHTSSSS